MSNIFEVIMNFFDREIERKIISDIVKEMENGKSRCIWIEGESGTGKSYFAKYILKQSRLPIFIYDDYSLIYKCNSNDIKKEFNYIIKIAVSFQTLHPKEFDRFLTKYFEKLSPISWVEVLIELIPDITYTSWAKNLLKTPLNKLENPKKTITEKMYSSGLNKFFSELIIFMLSKVMLKEHIVLCIDDACWLDEQSIKTLKMVLNLSKNNPEISIKISFIIVTRSKKSLTDFEENYDLLEEYLNEVYENIFYFKIKNFNYSTTREYIKNKKGDFVEEKVSNIYEITSGNPQELFQTLKFTNAEIYDLISKQETAPSLIPQNYLSIELLLKLNKKNIYTFPIIGCLSIVRNDIIKNALLLSSKGIIENVFKNTFNYQLYDKCIELLAANDIINKNQNIELSHDSIKEIVIQYLKNSGDYPHYMDEITETIKKLCNEFREGNFYLTELLRLYNEYNPIRCFDEYKKQFKKQYYDNNIIKIVAEALTKDLAPYTADNIGKYIIPIIIECNFSGYYDLSFRICEIIYSLKNELPSIDLFDYLINFSKILIDKGFLNNKHKFNAIVLLDEALNCKYLTANKKIEGYLVSMSAYEHILNFEKISKLNQSAKFLVSDDDVSYTFKAMFLRNQGLICSHMNLENTYLESIKLANKIEDDREKNLMLGTCYNNLGLSYLYNGQIKEAINSFTISKRNLEMIGFDIFRVINNLGVCYILQNDFAKAYEYLLQAKSLNLSCVFEKICIQNNISIVNWKLNNKESAFEIINNIIQEYEKTKSKLVMIWCTVRLWSIEDIITLRKKSI